MNFEERLVWEKYQFFKVGISPNTYRKCRRKDINDIMEIEKAVENKIALEKVTQAAMMEIR